MARRSRSARATEGIARASRHPLQLARLMYSRLADLNTARFAEGRVDTSQAGQIQRLRISAFAPRATTSQQLRIRRSDRRGGPSPEAEFVGVSRNRKLSPWATIRQMAQHDRKPLKNAHDVVDGGLSRGIDTGCQLLSTASIAITRMPAVGGRSTRWFWMCRKTRQPP